MLSSAATKRLLPGVRQALDLVEPLCVELLLGLRAWLVSPKGRPDILDEDPPTRSRSSMFHKGRSALLHQGPLLIDHLLCVGSGEFLEPVALGLRELMGQPEDFAARALASLSTVTRARPNSSQTAMTTSASNTA